MRTFYVHCHCHLEVEDISSPSLIFSFSMVGLMLCSILEFEINIVVLRRGIIFDIGLANRFVVGVETIAKMND